MLELIVSCMRRLKRDFSRQLYQLLKVLIAVCSWPALIAYVILNGSAYMYSSFCMSVHIPVNCTLCAPQRMPLIVVFARPLQIEFSVTACSTSSIWRNWQEKNEEQPRRSRPPQRSWLVWLCVLKLKRSKKQLIKINLRTVHDYRVSSSEWNAWRSRERG